MPTNHRGDDMGDHVDNHSNKMKWSRENGELYGTADPHPNLPGEWEAEIYPENGQHHMSVSEPHWRCEDGTCMDVVGMGSYRTEKRAKVAAESLVKRSAEGRDMQTGRTGYDSGSRGRYKQPGRRYKQPGKGHDD